MADEVKHTPEILWFAQQFFNGLDTGLIRIETDADETWANVAARGRAAIREQGKDGNLKCGHPASLLIKSVESDYTVCELCECRAMKCDAELMEIRHRQERDVARDAAADLAKRLRELIEAVDAGALEMNSPEIGGGADVPPHPWHEEWLYHARVTLTKATQA